MSESARLRLTHFWEWTCGFEPGALTCSGVCALPAVMYRSANQDVHVVDADGVSLEDRQRDRKRKGIDKGARGLNEGLAANKNYENPLSQPDSDESDDEEAQI